jgi:LacI family transcriptional regulator
VQKVRLKDVAAKAGVAINTASTILNRRPNSWASKKTEDRVFEAAEQLGYKPNRAAQALRFGRFSAIALVIADLNNPYYTSFADAMEEAAGERGYDVLIETWRNDLAREKRILDELLNRQVDGVAAFLSDPEALRETLVEREDSPFVVLSTTGEPPLPVDSVLADFEQGLRDAVNRLLQHGHKRFAFLCAIAKGHYAGGRPELFRRMLANAEHDIVSCDPSIGSAHQAALALLRRTDKPRPTALIALNDLSAIGAMRAAADCGLQVPRDLSIVGVDDIPLVSFLPTTLSTIAQPISAMARKALELLIARIEGKERLPVQTAVFPTTFIPRESIGPNTTA